MITVEKAQAQVEKFLNDTYDARCMSQKCRDYRDHKQWTEQQAQRLRARGQAPIVVNRLRYKIEGLVGLYNMRKTDPKAYPRTQKHEEAAHPITDALRYVADNTTFDETRLEVAEEFFIEGYGGCIVDVRQRKDGEIEIQIGHIPWDRIYYDPHSRRKDFKDCRYMGVILWMARDEGEEKFPNINFDELINAADYTDETFEDRPRWVDTKNNRIRVALHFYMHKSQWHMCLFSGAQFVVKPQVSPFLDDEGEPTNPIELVAANVDRDNQRYSEARGFLDQQDEINHRRSKFLHAMSSRQTFGRKGHTKDVKALKREMSKPDGHVEFEGDEWGKDFGVIPTNDMSKAQVDLYIDAKSELDAVSFNAQLAGERQNGDLSGKAIDRLQQAGTIELNRQYSTLAGWETRIYRQVWGRIRQFWTQEKWIRVTDDQDALRWVGFNQPIPLQQMLEETINDESRNLIERQQAAMIFTQMMEMQDPRLGEIVETRNPVAELDVDIKIEQSFDFINVQQEQFQMLAQFAQSPEAGIDIIELIKLSELRGKDEIIEQIEQRRQAQAQASGNLAQLESAKAEADIVNTQADAANKEQQAIQRKAETLLMMTEPDRVTSIAV